VFVAIRGRWGRIVLALAAAALVGIVIGDRVAEAIGLDLGRVGDMHIFGASITAQLFMLIVTLLSALGPIEVRE
ncbi:MAG TPA: hypothetical protein VLA76_00840, partial [Candidatus Angelobacter sp.]|nr:hypothetical protein [Candidatus Angelobacter sp.]